MVEVMVGGGSMDQQAMDRKVPGPRCQGSRVFEEAASLRRRHRSSLRDSLHPSLSGKKANDVSRFLMLLARATFSLLARIRMHTPPFF